MDSYQTAHLEDENGPCVAFIVNTKDPSHLSHQHPYTFLLPLCRKMFASLIEFKATQFFRTAFIEQAAIMVSI